jgi:hypothetical protein
VNRVEKFSSLPSNVRLGGSISSHQSSVSFGYGITTTIEDNSLISMPSLITSGQLVLGSNVQYNVEVTNLLAEPTTNETRQANLTIATPAFFINSTSWLSGSFIGYGGIIIKAGGVLRVPSGDQLIIGGMNTLLISQGGRLELGEGATLQLRDTASMYFIYNGGLSCASGARIIFNDQTTMYTGPFLLELPTCLYLSNSSLPLVLGSTFNITGNATLVAAKDIQFATTLPISLTSGSSLTLATHQVLFKGGAVATTSTNTVRPKLVMSECTSARFAGPLQGVDLEWRSLTNYGINGTSSPCNAQPVLSLSDASSADIRAYTPLIVRFESFKSKVTSIHSSLFRCFGHRA